MGVKKKKNYLIKPPHICARARSDVPIIVVSARGDEVDRVVGLELGADDYLVKPFGLRELVGKWKGSKEV